MLLSEWLEFPSAPCLAGGGGGGNLMTAHVSMLLKSRASLTCFRACFLPGRAKDLSAPRYVSHSTLICAFKNFGLVPLKAVFRRFVKPSLGPSIAPRGYRHI